MSERVAQSGHDLIQRAGEIGQPRPDVRAFGGGLQGGFEGFRRLEHLRRTDVAADAFNAWAAPMAR